jgi:lipopolysaccharide export system protein LptA
MSETERQNIKKLQRRADLPKYIGFAAVLALCLTILGIGIGFYRARNYREFRMKGFPTELSKDLVAVINNYERTEFEGEFKKYYIRADKATTFADNHQELENVFLEIFNQEGENSDKISADKTIYIPAENKNFTAYFAGNVQIETRDALKIRTAQLTYKKETETAEAEEFVEFERENITGKSIGAFVSIREKRLELMKDVEINVFAENAQDQVAQSNLQNAKIKANYAMFDQTAQKIELSDNVFIGIVPDGQKAGMSQPTDISAARATASFENKKIRQINLSGNVDVYQKPTGFNSKWTRTKANSATAWFNDELKKLELNENVEIETAGVDAKPTKINAGYAIYEKDIDRFELKQGVQILTVEDSLPTKIKSSEAVYEQSKGIVILNGNAEIDNGREYLRGDHLTAELYPTKKVKNAFVRGNAYLKQTSAERTTEISAGELNASFDNAQNLINANALGNSNAVLVPANSSEYSKLTISAPQAIRATFRGAGLFEQINTEGRTTILLNVPNNSPEAANKKLTADRVKTFFNQSGKDLQRAEAVGNAELFVEPLQASAQNYKTSITAPRFDCEFFPTGNNARFCIAQNKTKTVRMPTVSTANRGTQTLLADKLTATFNQQTQDVERFEASGNTKFTELDRNGIAQQMIFTANDEIVRLRGGEPTVWDSRARARAAEIDWDTKNQKSFLRGNVSTTYYNQRQTGEATPFTESNKPVYITSANAEFNHAEETGLYTGNARAWQESNYVRADKLLINQKEGKLLAEGTVQSVLYNAKVRDRGKNPNVPVYAASQRMSYNRENRLLRYEENVDIRQGTDRLTAGVASVFLDEKNEMSQTIAEGNVVITQPNRRAFGDWAQYTAENESAILRGNPARVEDAENGSTQGAQITVYMRENRFVNEAKTNQTNTGRIRSVYKIKKNQ